MQTNHFYPLQNVLFQRSLRTSVLALWGLSAWLTVPGAHAEALGVATSRVEQAQQGVAVEWDGVLEAVRQTTVAAQTSGRVVTLNVKAGDKVAAGQVLATIDAREAAVSAQQSSAQNEQADAALRNAKLQLERTQHLRQQGFISQAALDTAQLQYDAAVAQKNQAKAASAQSGLVQSYTRVTAPFAGYVSATQAEVGDLAVPGKPLLTLYAPQPLRATVQVPSSRLGLARQAKTVQVQAGDSGRWMTPISTTSIQSADPVSQTTEWRLNLSAADAQGLIPGQQVRVRMEGEQAQSGSATMQLPRKAVVQRGELVAVYVWNGKTFSLRPVRLGQSTGNDMVAVLSGVKAGDEVALDPVKAASAGR